MSSAEDVIFETESLPSIQKDQAVMIETLNHRCLIFCFCVKYLMVPYNASLPTYFTRGGTLMYYVPEGTDKCGYYECSCCGSRFLDVRVYPTLVCPYCGEETDMELGPDDEMPEPIWSLDLTMKCRMRLRMLN